MPLPSTIWVKFTNEDAVLVTYNDPAGNAPRVTYIEPTAANVLVTYLGTQYILTWDSITETRMAFITGNADNGTFLRVSAPEGAPFVNTETGVGITLNSFVDGVDQGENILVGTFDYSSWVVTGFTSTDISAVSISYSAIQYTLAFNGVQWERFVIGNSVNGVSLIMDISGSNPLPDAGLNEPVIRRVFVGDNNTGETTIGLLSWENFAVTAFSGDTITAAAIVRNPVQYRLTYNSAIGSNTWSEFISGDTSDGIAIELANVADGSDLSQVVSCDIILHTFVAALDTPTTVGVVHYSNWAVVGTEGDISAATIVHKDSKLPLFVAVPADSFPGGYLLEVGDAGAGTPSDGFTIYTSATDDLPSEISFILDAVTQHYSLTWDSDTNIGTTDCPFVEWIGELPITEVFAASGTWTPSASIDTSTPVICQAWGNGSDGEADGGAGGGGGAYSARDIAANVDGTAWVVNCETGATSLSRDGFDDYLYAPGASGVSGGDAESLGFGDVKFSGGYGSLAANPDNDGGSGASSYKRGVDATGGDPGLSGGDGGNGGAAVDSSPGNPGSIPGGGGAGGGDGTAGGAGARGELRIHYRLSEATTGRRNVGRTGISIRGRMAVGTIGITYNA